MRPSAARHPRASRSLRRTPCDWSGVRGACRRHPCTASRRESASRCESSRLRTRGPSPPRSFRRPPRTKPVRAPAADACRPRAANSASPHAGERRRRSAPRRFASAPARSNPRALSDSCASRTRLAARPLTRRNAAPCATSLSGSCRTRAPRSPRILNAACSRGSGSPAWSGSTPNRSPHAYLRTSCSVRS